MRFINKFGCYGRPSNLVPTEAKLARRESCTYEPASALLERIRAERALADARGRPKKSRKPG
jgi:hypothetical protein